MMKVLVTAQLDGTHSCLYGYSEGIKKYAEVVFAISPFWDSNLKFDIIHIQWPEVLIVGHQYTESLLGLLEERFLYWKANGAKIVLTEHNLIPHHERFLDRKIYELVYRYVDGVVHLGNYSLQKGVESGTNLRRIDVKIDHPNYIGLENDVTRSEARQRFKLSDKDLVFLSFGSIRHQEEEDLLLNSFFELKAPNKKLILTRSLMLKDKTGKRYFWRRLKYEFKKRILASKGVIVDDNQIIDDADVQFYMNAADVVVVPRTRNLNSGVIFLGFSFAKLVIGPNIGNITEYLESLGNIGFDPSQSKSLREAMTRSVELKDSNIPQKNYQFALKFCDMDKIGKEHCDLYLRLINDGK